MALNHVDASPEYIAGLWADIRRTLGPKPDRPALTPVQAAGSEATAKMTGMAISMALFFFFKKRLPHWQMEKAECDEIGMAWGGVIDWLFPGTGLRGAMRWLEEKLAQYQPLVDAVKVTGKVTGKRIMHPEQYALPEPVQDNQETPPADPGTSNQDNQDQARGSTATPGKKSPMADLMEGGANG